MVGKAVIFGNKDVAESEYQKLRSEDYRNKGKDDAILESASFGIFLLHVLGNR